MPASSLVEELGAAERHRENVFDVRCAAGKRSDRRRVEQPSSDGDQPHPEEARGDLEPAGGVPMRDAVLSQVKTDADDGYQHP